MAVSEVFIDSSGFLALWDASDRFHPSAVQLQSELARKRRRFVTTEYVLNETVTLLLVRHSHSAAADFIDTVERTGLLQVEWIGPDRFFLAASLFKRHNDKMWSFTDCTSFVVMRELKIRDAFTTDHHFEQAGYRVLLKAC